MKNKTKNFMIAQAKKVIKNIKSDSIIGIVSELIGNSHYFNEPVFFYNAFGLQGGTIWQLAVHIKANRKLKHD